MSMSKLEIIQRVKVRIFEVKQAAVQKIEDDLGGLLKWLGEEEIRISKEALTNGRPSIEAETPILEPCNKVEPDRQ